ncbi:helix-turn-helix domain-containing protein [Rhodococcus sp. AB351]|uniref:helix-turn-helix domain-containing protein n=1 Tax=Rhodococcus sp. AB351 TaxID=3413280 RepID=UPI003C289AB6
MPTTTTYLTTREVADRLQVSPTTVRTLVATKGLPTYRLGNRLRFVAAEVDAWARARGSRSVDTAAAPASETDDYRAEIIRLVDTAPTLTAAQCDLIRAVLGSAPVAQTQ